MKKVIVKCLLKIFAFVKSKIISIKQFFKHIKTNMINDLKSQAYDLIKSTQARNVQIVSIHSTLDPLESVQATEIAVLIDLNAQISNYVEPTDSVTPVEVPVQ